jgi:Sec-independent protein translocase protein TatA
MGRSDGLGVGAWLLILVGILVLAGAVALTVYGGSVRPAQHEVEQVISNDRFPS